MRPGVEGGAHVEGLRVLRSTPLGEHGGELPAEGEGRGRQDHRGLGEEPLPQQVSDGKWCDADDLTVAVSREPDDVFPEQILLDRKSTRLNSSHVSISYAVFCLKKKQQKQEIL